VCLRRLTPRSPAHPRTRDRCAPPRNPAATSARPRRQKRHVNSHLVFLGDGPEILLHPDDAAAAGVGDGAPVTVRSEAGELTGTARVDPGMRRGAVSVPHGHADANVNRLTSHREADPVTGMARYSGIPVTLQPADAPSPPAEAADRR
jgi:predicted molibdopterin-dependent oxidoreductase YjgC